MDKIIMKDIFLANGIKTAKYYFFNKNEYKLEYNKIINEIEIKLVYPLFVKPANLGSSIGISKCKNRAELDLAIEVALCYDNRILVEESVEDNIEVNCAVLGNSENQIPSKVEYPKTWGEFLNFDEKYIQREKSSNKELGINGNLKKHIKREKLSNETEDNVKKIAQKAFKIFDCKGVVRIDFLVKKNSGEIYLNEINSIPGSLSFYLFKEQGINFKALLNRLIDIAKKEKLKKDKNKFSYESKALANFGSASKFNK
jgi:D-alanine-D-alanine ligase